MIDAGIVDLALLIENWSSKGKITMVLEENSPPKNSLRTGRRRKAKGTGHERLVEILSVAKDLFNKYGYENVSTRKIAESAGISQATLFTYYSTREEIISGVIRNSLIEFNKIMMAVDSSLRDGEEWLRGTAEAFVQYGIEHPAEYKLIFMTVKFYSAPYNKMVPPTLNSEYARAHFFVIFYERMKKGISSGLIRGDIGTPEDVTQAFFGALHGGISLVVAHPYSPWENPDEILRIQKDIIVMGMLASRPLAKKLAPVFHPCPSRIKKNRTG